MCLIGVHVFWVSVRGNVWEVELRRERERECVCVCVRGGEKLGVYSKKKGGEHLLGFVQTSVTITSASFS